MLVKRTSPFSGKENTMEISGVTSTELYEYFRGSGNIQDVFPHLTPDEREFIMTGITPEEWEETFR